MKSIIVGEAEVLGGSRKMETHAEHLNSNLVCHLKVERKTLSRALWPQVEGMKDNSEPMENEKPAKPAGASAEFTQVSKGLSVEPNLPAPW